MYSKIEKSSKYDMNENDDVYCCLLDAKKTFDCIIYVFVIQTYSNVHNNCVAAWQKGA